MVNGKKVVVILPAFNAAQTLESTYREIPFDVVDEAILTDDASTDDTIEIAKRLRIHRVIKHRTNAGYGQNQKTSYDAALEAGADIVVMLHPDYQYTPRLIPAMVSMIANGVYDVVLGSRILGGKAIKGGMPLYKYFSNRMLTAFQNLITGSKLSEYHTGYRAYSREVLENVFYDKLSNDFVFDNQILSRIILKDFAIGEVSCPASYLPSSSTISFWRSVRYGLGVIHVCFRHLLSRMLRQPNVDRSERERDRSIIEFEVVHQPS